ncbi:hypothetical protein HPP92_001893 [Vanilla planifolia]|uniref:Uncharacterized protein n=1 Tax=Vanilla planifolia TaxID=51239 RepID=A0A835S493_VANPL|nr:hypothetical protein HPP92_001893 [Vanilla planifolia]
MAALSNACLFQGVSIRILASHGQVFPVYSSPKKFQATFMADFRSRNVRNPTKWMRSSHSNVKRFPIVEFARKDGQFDPLSVEPPPYHSYLDSTSGQLEPASGARASIPGKEYWPEGTAERVRAARTPEPVGKSETKPSYGKKPGSRRKRYKVQATASENSEVIVNISAELNSRNDVDARFDLNGKINKDNTDGLSLPEASGSVESLEESKEISNEYVIYRVEEPDNLSPYEMDKKIGRSHPFLDPSKVRPIEEPQTSEDLWWNWRKPEEGRWSRWQRRRPDVDTVFAKAMAETGQIKLYGDQPTLTEAALAKARKEVFKEERLLAEQRRLEEIGPIAYYSEWVKAWTKDTSREAVQKHFEETGEDENTQLITMFQHQTAEEFRIMMGTDVRDST